MKSKNKKPKIVVVGGGTGVFTVLTGLRGYPAELSAIATMADDGGSTGMLREDFGILPPGDVRRALVALSKTEDKILSALFTYRFEEGTGLHGHSFGNLMLTALERLVGSFEGAIEAASKILGVEGSVIPVSLAPGKLFAELEDGQIIKGEANIDIPSHDGKLRIERIWLEPKLKLNPSAKKAILGADLVVIGPGDLYTSLLPNILVGGMPEALKKTKAKIAYVTNLMTKFGETNNFEATDFLEAVEKHVGPGVLDYVVANNERPSPARLRAYVKERASLVELERKNFSANPLLVSAPLIRAKGFIRHDPEKLARVLWELV
ncbi:MAG: YvcK family protein [Candidatus Liptonbacteria bacterium]|nr:YvcK family protein [Candidatus Liptonbacteria bacterium]